jgi:2-keto-4-pentenoate hydratase/2-oxohepta-3-ene-1,7-dioic acid hydratase in catechol pathway
MRFARFRVNGRERYGVVEGDRLREIRGNIFGKWRSTETIHAIDSVTLLAPTKPTQVLAMGANYADHVAQSESSSGHSFREPVPFVKNPASLSAYNDPILITPEASEVHYEGELVIVMGKEARRVPAEKASEYIFGYTVGNDVTEKSAWEKDFSLWRAKGITSWGPVGPWIDTDIDPLKERINVYVNEELHHGVGINELIYKPFEIVALLSSFVWLYPGDLIFTGAAGITRPMKDGDLVEVEITGLGTLRNPVRDE